MHPVASLAWPWNVFTRKTHMNPDVMGIYIVIALVGGAWILFVR